MPSNENNYKQVVHVDINKQSQRRKHADKLEKFHRITSNRKSILLKNEMNIIYYEEILGCLTYVPNSNKSVIATCKTTITRMEINICLN